MSDFDRRHGSPHHDQNAADEKMMSGNGNQLDSASAVPNPTTAASTSHSAAAANPDSTISAAVENPDGPVSNLSTTTSPSPANPDATSSAAVENPDAPISNPTTTASTSQSAAPAALSRQHSPPRPPLTSQQQGPSNPTVFGVKVAAAPWRAMWSNENPSAFERVDATVAPRKKLAWGSGVSNPTTTASTSHSASPANPDSPVSAAPASFSRQHLPPPPPPTSHQQRPSNPTASGGVLGAESWSWCDVWVNGKPSGFKELAWGVQGANSTEKSPGFRMRVDSDDGISDDERGSAVAPGPGCSRKRNQITWPLSKQPVKKQTREAPPKHTHTLSLDKVMEFIATWRDPCLQHPDDSDMILGSMLTWYAHTLTQKEWHVMKNCFTQYPAIALLNVAVRAMGTPVCPPFEPPIPVGIDAKRGSSNEGSNKPRDSSLSPSLPPPSLSFVHK